MGELNSEMNDILEFLKSKEVKADRLLPAITIFSAFKKALTTAKKESKEMSFAELKALLPTQEQKAVELLAKDKELKVVTSKAFLNRLANEYKEITAAYEGCLLQLVQNEGKNMQALAPEVLQLLEAIIEEYYPKRKDLKVYNPFAGFGSYLLSPQVKEYFAQDENDRAWAIGTLRLYLHGKETKNYHHEDSILSWKGEDDYDLILSNFPFRILKEKEQLTAIEKMVGYANRFRFDQSFLAMLAKAKSPSLTLHSSHVLYGKMSENETRKEIITNDLLDMVILLPEMIHLDNMFATTFLLLNPKKKDKGVVRMIDGRSFVTPPGKKARLLTEDLVKAIKKKDKNFYREVKVEEIVEQNYNFDPERYIYKTVELPDFAESARPLSGEDGLVDILPLSKARRDDVYRISLARATDDPFGEREDPILLTKFRGPVYEVVPRDIILSFQNEKVLFAHYKIEGNINEPSALMQFMKVLRLKEKVRINREYLMLMLTTDYVLAQINRYKVGSDDRFTLSDADLARIKIPYCDIKSQRKLVDKLLDEREKAEKEARKRAKEEAKKK